MLDTNAKLYNIIFKDLIKSSCHESITSLPFPVLPKARKEHYEEEETIGWKRNIL